MTEPVAFSTAAGKAASGKVAMAITNEYMAIILFYVVGLTCE